MLMTIIRLVLKLVVFVLLISLSYTKFIGEKVLLAIAVWRLGDEQADDSTVR